MIKIIATEIVVATRNNDKLKEIKALLKDLPVKVVSLDAFKNVPQVRETGKTLEANAKKKAVQVSRFLKRLVVADDSGLEVTALKGRPGVYSARFSGKGATYASNNEKVLKLLSGVPAKKRRACFRCVVSVADKGKVVGMAEGCCNGRITFKPMGRAGFGYDPIFMPDGRKKTFSQLSPQEKNKISHRGKALLRSKGIIEKYLSLTF